MEEEKGTALINEISLLFKRSKIKELHESSCEKLHLRINDLIELYHEQKRKNAKLVKNHTYFLKQIDKRNLVQTASLSKKDRMLRQQSKMAAMGEMMDAVAHQWKQPLNALSMMNDMLLDDFLRGDVNETYVKDVVSVTQMQINHMVNTLNEFRTFFRPSKDPTDFSVEECLESVQVLMRDELLKNSITISIDIKDDIILHGQINEFKHLFLNLISNTIDAFNEKEIQNRTIDIVLYINDTHGVIEFQDNAGGIPEHVIDSIFKPNVTTKAEGKGTGIGLYMSSQIVQKHNASITVINNKNGALFTIVSKH